MYETLMRPRRPSLKKKPNWSDLDLHELSENMREDQRVTLQRLRQLRTSMTDCASSPTSSSNDSAEELSFIARLTRAVTLVFTFRRNRT